MHEAGIVDEMLRAAECAARDAGCGTIHRIVLRVGALSSAVPDALEFAFAALKAGTLAADATLEIERVPAMAFCDRCRQEFTVDDAFLVCPACGEPATDLRHGTELDLLRIEAG